MEILKRCVFPFRIQLWLCGFLVYFYLPWNVVCLCGALLWVLPCEVLGLVLTHILKSRWTSMICKIFFLTNYNHVIDILIIGILFADPVLWFCPMDSWKIMPWHPHQIQFQNFLLQAKILLETLLIMHKLIDQNADGWYVFV